MTKTLHGYLAIVLAVLQWTMPLVAQTRLGSPAVPSGVTIRSVLPVEAPPEPPEEPEPPPEQEDPELEFTGTELTVCDSGCDSTTIQAAMTAASCTDIIRVEAGDVFTEQLSATDKDNGSYCPILVTTSETTGMLPPNGDMLCPTDYVGGVGDCTPNTDPDLLPTIRSIQNTANQNVPALTVEPSANGWMFRRLRFTNNFTGSGTVIRFGENAAPYDTRDSQPTNIRGDQLYLDFRTEHPYWGQRRGIDLHGKALTLTGSFLWGIGGSGQDSIGVWVCNGEGPTIIRNNFIQGGTEPIIFCGDRTRISTVAVAANATTTSANLSWGSGQTPLGDCPFVGQTIALGLSGSTNREHPTVTDVTNCTATSATVTWSPAASVVPDVPGDHRWGVNPGDCGIMPDGCEQGVLVEYNKISRDPATRNVGIVGEPTVTSLQAAGGGALAAGTYSVRILARPVVQGSTISGTASEAQAVVVSANGAITWSVTSLHADVGAYRLYVTHPDGVVRFEQFSASSGTYDGNGATGSLPAATQWQYKNLLEIKACIDCLIRYNDLAYSWKANAGNGSCIWNKSTNQAAAIATPSLTNNAPWGENTNVTFEYNVCRHAPGFFITQGTGYENNNNFYRPKGTFGTIVRNNLAFDIDNVEYGESGQEPFYLNAGCHGCAVDHNTVDYTGNSYTLEVDSTASKSLYLSGGFSFSNNLLSRRNTAGGVRASGFAEGTASIASTTKGVGPGGTYTMTGNVWGTSVSGPSASSQTYPNHNVTSPVGNVFISYTAWRSLFVDPASETVEGYALATPSDYATAGSDGAAIGVTSMLLLATEIAKARSGIIGEQSGGEIPETPPGDTASTFYLTRSTPNITPAFDDDWDLTNSTDRFALSPIATGTVIGESAGPGGTATNPEFHLVAQFVGPAMAAQTIDGTVACIINAQVNQTSLDATVAIGIRVVSNDGTTVRGTLLDPVGSDTIGGQQELWVSSSTYRPRGCYTGMDASEIPLSSLVVQDGDRPVVEIGCKDHGTGQGHCDFLIGDSEATDLVTVDDGDYDPDTSGQVGNPVIRFSEPILLSP